MIYKYLSDMAHKMPEKIAVIQKQRYVTYGDLDIKVSRLATFLLEEGILIGERVCIMVENSPEYIVSYFGVQKSGGISVAVSPQSSVHELRKIFNNCLPVVLVVERKYLRSVLEAIDEETSLKSIIVISDRSIEESLLLSNSKGKVPSRIKCLTLKTALENGDVNKSYPLLDGKNIASIIYTSGTTGKPKGVTLSHANFVHNANSIIKYLNLTMNDRVMVVLPFYYSYGTSLLTTHIMMGGSLVLENSFMYPNVILDRMVENNTTGFAGVPSTFAILLNRSNIRNYRFPKLRYVTQAGGPMSPKHAKELAELLPDKEIYIMYGQTEATARLTYLKPQDLFRKPGSIGKAIPGVKIELVKDGEKPAKKGEEGEIVVNGENIMIGYWGNPEETKKVLRSGKLYTGDTASIDEEGYFYIVSRRSDMIKSGAHRISPKEIEEVIVEIPEVHEVAVVGTEDDILGQAIKAVIVLKEGCGLETKEVQRHCKQKLAPFKIPKEAVFVDELPKTSSGKVRKYLLKKTKEINTVLVNSFLEESARRYPDKIALITSCGRYTYREIDEMANKIAHAILATRFEKGDRVTLYMDNSLETVASVFGVLKAGGIFSTINPTTKTKKLTYILNNCRSSLLISSQEKLSLITEACNNTPSLRNVFLTGSKISSVKGLQKKVISFKEIFDSSNSQVPVSHSIDIDLANIIYTSGSTGNPKGVMMSHFNMVSAANSIIQYLEKTSEDVILNTLPMSFDYGLYQVLMGFKVGATVILENGFLYPYKIIDTIVKEKVTGFPIVPTMSAILLRMEGIKKHDFEHLRYISNTAAALPIVHIKKMKELFPKAKIYSMYGLTECKRVSYLPPEQLDIRPTSVGKAIPNTEVYIVDENGGQVEPGIIGELVVRGSNVMRGYWEMPEETAKTLRPGKYPGEVILYTGDLFKMDEKGYLYFIDRKDDIFKCQGEKVSPKEIENVLYEIEGVVEAAIVGVDDLVLGKAVKAFLVLKDEVKMAEREVQKFCLNHLEDFMVPKYVEFCKELPKTPTGKISRLSLK